MSDPVAKYRCSDKGCNAAWESWLDQNLGACPNCNGKYYVWLNYKKLFPRGVKIPPPDTD